MSATGGSGHTKAERRAARELIGKYHEAELTKLIEHVREELWKFCVGTGTGARAPFAARTLAIWQAENDAPNWCALTGKLELVGNAGY